MMGGKGTDNRQQVLEEEEEKEMHIHERGC
jgi:hypothetical protein